MSALYSESIPSLGQVPELFETAMIAFRSPHYPLLEQRLLSPRCYLVCQYSRSDLSAFHFLTRPIVNTAKCDQFPAADRQRPLELGQQQIATPSIASFINITHTTISSIIFSAFKSTCFKGFAGHPILLC